MKKIMLLAFAFALMASNGSAQDESRSKLQFGLKAGLNYANVYDAVGEEFDADPKLGLAAGIFIGIPIGKYFGIQPEVLFSQKGFQATGSLLTIDYKFTRTTSYIDIPLMVQVKPFSFLTILAGPQYSYLIKQRTDFTNTLFSSVQEEIFDNEDIRVNTLGFIGGADLNFNHLVIGARIGCDFQKNNGDEASTTPRYKNVWSQATIGYRF